MHINSTTDLPVTQNSENRINHVSTDDFSSLFTALLAVTDMGEDYENISFDSRASQQSGDNQEETDSVIEPDDPLLNQDYLPEAGVIYTMTPAMTDFASKEDKTPDDNDLSFFSSTIKTHSLPTLTLNSSETTAKSDGINQLPQTYQVSVTSAVAPQLSPSMEPITSVVPAIVETQMQIPAKMPLISIELPQTTGTPEWQQSLNHQILHFIRAGIHHAELRLRPETLGPIQVNLRVSHEQVEMSVMAQHSQTRDALDHALPALRQLLSESGLQLSDHQMGTGTANYYAKEKGEHEKWMSPQTAENTPEEPALTLTENMPLQLGVNVFV